MPQTDPTTPSFEAAPIEIEESGEAPLDGGEKSQTEPTSEQVDAQQESGLEATFTLVEKIQEYGIQMKIFSQHEADTYTLPDRQLESKEITKEIKELTAEIKKPNLNPEEKKVLEEKRALHIVELQYNFVAFMNKMLPRFIENVTVEAKAHPEKQDSVVQQLRDVNKIAPQWEALNKNFSETFRTMKIKYKDIISNTYLAELNDSLYTELEVGKDRLPEAEKEQSGVLFNKIGELDAKFQRILNMTI